MAVDYIKRDDALNFEMEIEADPDEIQAITKGVALYYDFLEKLPVAKPGYTRRGRWLHVDMCMTICSECGYIGCDSRYCGNCGAKMEGSG